MGCQSSSDAAQVVVDSFADSRQRDVLNLAEELEQENENDKKYLQSIFNRLDLCQNGFLTLEDLVKGARTDPEFQSRLRVMDIDEADLEQLFEMILGLFRLFMFQKGAFSIIKIKKLYKHA